MFVVLQFCLFFNKLHTHFDFRIKASFLWTDPCQDMQNPIENLSNGWTATHFVLNLSKKSESEQSHAPWDLDPILCPTGALVQHLGPDLGKVQFGTRKIANTVSLRPFIHVRDSSIKLKFRGTRQSDRFAELSRQEVRTCFPFATITVVLHSIHI